MINNSDINEKELNEDVYDESLIVLNTGEMITAKNITIRNKNNWDKVWVNNILQKCEILKVNALTLLLYLMNNRDYGNNRVLNTQREMSNNTGISLSVINKLLKDFIRVGIIKKANNCQYIINPSLIMRGNDNKQRYLLIQYNSISVKDRDKNIKRKIASIAEEYDIEIQNENEDMEVM